MATINWLNVSRADVTDSLRFSESKLTSNGMKVIDIAFNNKQAILQTPLLPAPFGANDRFEAGKFKMLLQLAPTKPGEHEQAVIDQFIRMLKALDNKVIDHVFNNQESILNVTGKPREIIADKYSPLVKVKDGRSAIDLKFDTKYEIYTPNKEAKELQDITPGSLNITLVRLSGIWANSKGFGILAKTIQVMTTPGVPEKRIEGCAIVNIE